MSSFFDCFAFVPAQITRLQKSTPKLVKIWGFGVLFIDLGLRSFDTFSDIAVAAEFYMSGDTHWFGISMAILILSSLRLAYLAMKQESQWNKTWTSPGVILQGILGGLSLRPIFMVFKLLISSNSDLTSPQAYQLQRMLEEERFEEGLFETMLQLFLQSYVFFIKVQQGDAEAISFISICSVISSIICMAKTLLERFPSRARALSWGNKIFLFVFVLCGVLSRCASIVGTNLFVPWGSFFVFPAEIFFIFFIHSTMIKWNQIDWNAVFYGISKNNKIVPSDSTASDRGIRENKNLRGSLSSTFLSVFVFCPISIASEISSIDLGMETLSLIALLWLHSLLAVALILHPPGPNSIFLGFILMGCVCLQLVFLQFHNQLIFRITKSSADFLRKIQMHSELRMATKASDILVPDSLPGEVDVGYIENEESFLMAAGRLEKYLCELSDRPHEQIKKARELGIELLERGADPLWDNKNGQSVFSVSTPGFQHALVSRLIDMEKAGVYFDENGALKLERDSSWAFIEPYVIKGLNVSSFKHPDIEGQPFDFRLDLTINGSMYQDEKITTMIFKCLEGCKVQTMDFTDHRFTKEQCSIFSEAILANNTCRHLKLSKCHFPEGCAKQVLSGISKNFCLESIDLSESNLTNELTLYLLEDLKGNKNLKLLDLSTNSLSDDPLDHPEMWPKFLSLLLSVPLGDLRFRYNEKITSASTILFLKGATDRGDQKCLVHWKGTPAKTEVSMTRLLDLIRDLIKTKQPYLKEMALAAEQGYTKVFDRVISDLDPTFSIDTPLRPTGETAIMLACSNARIPLVQHLLDFHHAKVVNHQQTALTFAMKHKEKHRNLVLLILDQPDCVVQFSHIDECIKQSDFQTFEDLITANCSRDITQDQFDSLLFTALSDPNPKFIEILFENGCHLNCRDSRECTPLLVSAREGHLPAAEKILELCGKEDHDIHAVDVHAPDLQGNTPLHYAVQKELTDLCENLISHGAIPTTKNRDGASPLTLACILKQTTILKLFLSQQMLSTSELGLALQVAWENRSAGREKIRMLVSSGAHIPTDLLCDALTDRALNEVKLFLDHEVSVNSEHSRTGKTPLYVACELRDPNMIELLLQQNADPNLLTSFGETPLHISTRLQHLKSVELLLKYKADPCIVNNTSESPIQIAACDPQLRSVSLLRILMNSASKMTQELFTPVLSLVWKDRAKGLDFLSVLLELSPISGPLLFTPEFLGEAVKERHVAAVQLLLSHGADADQPMSQETGETPLTEACTLGDFNLLKILLERASPNISDLSGETPLHISTRKQDVRCIELLLLKGADPCLKNISGESPLEIAACELHSVSLVELLSKQVQNKEIFSQVLRKTWKERSKIFEVFNALLCNAPFKQPAALCPELLGEAVHDLNLTAVELLLKMGADPNSDAFISRGMKQNPLCLACILGDTKIVTALLGHKSTNPNLYDSSNRTPLHIVSQNREISDVEIFSLLVKRGADPTLLNTHQKTAFEIAAIESRSPFMTRLLFKQVLAKNKSLCDSVLRKAWKERGRGLDIVKTLLVDSDPINTEFLDEAVREMSSEAVDLLLKRGANPNAQSFLCLSTEISDFPTIKLLLNSGADVNSKNEQGLTPLHIAVRDKEPRLVEYFVEKGANLSEKNRKDLSAVQMACLSDAFEILEFFFQTQPPSEDLLDFAIKNEKKKSFELIMRYGKSWLNLDPPLLRASENDRLDWAKLFLEYGANPHFQDPETGNTPLHMAARGTNSALVSLLISNMKDTLARNKQGQRALHIAFEQRNPEIIDLLLGPVKTLHSIFKRVNRNGGQHGDSVLDQMVREVLESADEQLIDLLFTYTNDSRLDLKLPILSKCTIFPDFPSPTTIDDTNNVSLKFFNTLGKPLSDIIQPSRISLTPGIPGLNNFRVELRGNIFRISYSFSEVGTFRFSILFDGRHVIGREVTVQVLDEPKCSDHQAPTSLAPLVSSFSVADVVLPYCLTAHPKTGQLALSDFNGGNVVVMNTLGTRMFGLAHRKAELDGPQGVAFSQDGSKLFVLSKFSKCVLEFDLHEEGLGGECSTLLPVRAFGADRLKDPFDLAVSNSSRHIFVCDKEANAIVMFDFNGKFVKSFGGHSHIGGLKDPCGIAVDDESETLGVVDFGNPKVFLFKTNGSLLGTYAGSDSFSELGVDQRKSIAFDQTNGVFVIGDSSQLRVSVLTQHHEIRPIIGNTTQGSAEFQTITGVAVGRNGTLYVLDRGARTVQTFLPRFSDL